MGLVGSKNDTAGLLTQDLMNHKRSGIPCQGIWEGAGLGCHVWPPLAVLGAGLERWHQGRVKRYQRMILQEHHVSREGATGVWKDWYTLMVYRLPKQGKANLRNDQKSPGITMLCSFTAKNTLEGPYSSELPLHKEKRNQTKHGKRSTGHFIKDSS